MQTWLVASHAMPVGQSPQARLWPQPSPIVAAVLAARDRAGVRNAGRIAADVGDAGAAAGLGRGAGVAADDRVAAAVADRSAIGHRPAGAGRDRRDAARCSADAGRAGAAAGVGRGAVTAVDDAVAAVADVAAVLAARRVTGDDRRRARRPIRRRRQVAIMDVGRGVDLDVQRSVVAGRSIRKVHPATRETSATDAEHQVRK